jgi:hypothetical protein
MSVPPIVDFGLIQASAVPVIVDRTDEMRPQCRAGVNDGRYFTRAPPSQSMIAPVMKPLPISMTMVCATSPRLAYPSDRERLRFALQQIAALFLREMAPDWRFHDAGRDDIHLAGFEFERQGGGSRVECTVDRGKSDGTGEGGASGGRGHEGDGTVGCKRAEGKLGCRKLRQ